MLAPLAPTLEKLNLGYNKLGGTITDDIAAFTKLNELDLHDMGLKGAWHDQAYRARKRIEKRIACAGPVPKELSKLTNLAKLFLHGNAALEKPPGCPVDRDGDMCYNSKEEVAAFLRCLDA